MEGHPLNEEFFGRTPFQKNAAFYRRMLFHAREIEWKGAIQKEVASGTIPVLCYSLKPLL